MSWVENRELQIFFKECRLAGMSVHESYAVADPDKCGVALLATAGRLAEGVGCVVFFGNGEWVVWDYKTGREVGRGTGRNSRAFATVEDAIEDASNRLREL